jgi:hypothetical protein
MQVQLMNVGITCENCGDHLLAFQGKWRGGIDPAVVTIAWEAHQCRPLRKALWRLRGGLRLAVFLTVAWVLGVWFAAETDLVPYGRRDTLDDPVWVMIITIPAWLWGAWWVHQGFRKGSR